MQVEELRGWMQESTWEEEMVVIWLLLFVRLVYRAFEDRVFPEGLKWATIVLLRKGKGGHWGRGIIDVAWKVYVNDVNFRLKGSVELNKSLLGFRKGRVTGTDTPEANLEQQLVGLSHEPLFQFFLDVRKTFNSLDWERCMELLRGYGMGKNLTRLLSHYWGRQHIVLKAGRFLGKVFGMVRGVTK